MIQNFLGTPVNFSFRLISQCFTLNKLLAIKTIILMVFLVIGDKQSAIKNL